MAIDEENLGERFQDQDLEQLLAEAAESDILPELNAAPLPAEIASKPSAPGGASRITPKWMQKSPRPANPRVEEEDDVPESLMLEGKKGSSPPLDRNRRRLSSGFPDELPPPVPGPATRNTRAQWETTKAQQRLHEQKVGVMYVFIDLAAGFTLVRV